MWCWRGLAGWVEERGGEVKGTEDGLWGRGVVGRDILVDGSVARGEEGGRRSMERSGEECLRGFYPAPL